MIIVHMLARFKSFLLSIIALFRRALCCFSRRRKTSHSECEILTSINVVHTNNQNANRSQEEAERDWNSWDDSPRTVSEHIQQYRQKLVQPKSVENNEPAVDFFQDMTPKVLKQQKIFIATNKNEPENFSRLQATSAAIIPHFQSTELEDLSDENADDGEQTGWDVINDDMAKQIIREKRREARAQRNQRLQQQKLQQQMQNNLYAYR